MEKGSVRLIIVSLTIVFALAASSPLAAETSSLDLFDAGMRSFESGNFEEAYNHFFLAFTDDPGNPEINFWLGRAAFEKHDYEAAVMAFERVLFQSPDAARVKLELARAFFHLKSYQTARQYFEEVLATDPPEKVRGNIQSFLTAIEAAETRHFFNGLLSTGVNWDDNVRVSPVDQRISTILGDVILTADSATPRNDRILTGTLSLNHAYRFPQDRLWWKTSGVSYNALYQFEDDLDIAFLNLSSGPEFYMGNYALEIQGVFNHLYLASERYLSSWGLSTIGSWAAHPRFFMNLGLKAEHKEYWQDEDKNGGNLSAVGNGFFILPPHRIGISIGGEFEDAESDINSFRRFKTSIRYDRASAYGISLFAGVRYQKTEYDQVEPMFGVERSDDLTEGSAGLSKLLWQSSDRKYGLSGLFSYTYTKASSNIDLYTYKKNVFTTSVEFRF